MSPTLSVCCLTDDQTASTATILGLFRPLADEIVVAVDSRVETALCQVLYGEVADRLLRYEYAPPVERPFAWLHAQCTGDWIMRIDSDEVPGADLLAALPTLIRARDVHQFPIQRRWLLEDAGHALNEAPWWPDYQFRLVRNDPATLWFSGISHSSAHPARPARHLDMPLYHLDTLVNSYEKRAAKVARYDSRSNRETEGAIPNRIFYLPEDHRAHPLALVPSKDVSLIEGVIHAGTRPVEPSSSSPEIPIAGRDAVDNHWEERPLGEKARAAKIEFFEENHTLRSGERRTLHFRVSNEGDEAWRYGPLRRPVITLCYRWIGLDGEAVVPEGLHSPLTADLHPDTTDIVPATVDAPDVPGRYVLEVDLVNGRSEWFGSTVREEFEVLP